MLKRLSFMVVLTLLILPFSSAAAQGDPFPNRFVAPNAGITVNYPIGWTIEQGTSSVTLSSGVIWLNVFRADPDTLGFAPGDGAALLAYAFNPIDETVAFDPAGMTSQPGTYGPTFLYHYDDTNENGAYSGVVAAVEAPDGTYFLADIYPRQGSGVAPEDLSLSLELINRIEILSGEAVSPPAQAEPEFEFFESGIGVNLPEGWSDLLDESDFLTLESDQTVFEPRWYFPDEVLDLGLETGDVPGVLADVASRLEIDFDPASVETRVVNGRTIWLTDYNLDDSAGAFEAMLAGVVLDDGTVLTGFVFPAMSATLDERDDALAILASADLVAGEVAPPDAPLSESYTFEGDGVTFYYPAEWTLRDDDGFIYLSSGVSLIDPYYTLAADLPDQGVVIGDLAGGLEALFTSLYEDIPYTPSAVERHVVNGHVVLVYPLEHAADASTHEHWLTATELEDGTQFYLDAYPRSGTALQETELVLRVSAGAALEAETVG